MRIISTDEIKKNIKEMCIEANYELSADVKDKLYDQAQKEESVLGKQILQQLKENLDIAREDSIPICQDTGMAVVFLKIGQDVHFEGENLEDAINDGIRQGYVEGYLRKSVVKDPIERENTKDNTSDRHPTGGRCRKRRPRRRPPASRSCRRASRSGRQPSPIPRPTGRRTSMPLCALSRGIFRRAVPYSGASVMRSIVPSLACLGQLLGRSVAAPFAFEMLQRIGRHRGPAPAVLHDVEGRIDRVAHRLRVGLVLSCDVERRAVVG